jgi:hypothetical protein
VQLGVSALGQKRTLLLTAAVVQRVPKGVVTVASYDDKTRLDHHRRVHENALLQASRSFSEHSVWIGSGHIRRDPRGRVFRIADEL